MNINNLWSQRFYYYLKETSRYLRYMFNDHLMIVLLIGISAGAVYYKQWLFQLPEAFPFEWVIAVILGLLLTSTPIRSFLKEPDLVFLLAIEHKMNVYFRNVLIYSFIIQCFILLITYLALMPMYILFTNSTFLKLVLVFFIVLVLKSWNMLLVWRMFHIVELDLWKYDNVIRLIFNIVFLVLLFASAPFQYLFILIGIAILWAISFGFISRGKSIKWESLLKEENKQMNRFYQIANLFIDVPHLRNEIKPRRWLDWVSASIPLQQERVFHFLYLKTFIRSGEYLGLYIRLLVIAAVLLIGIDVAYAGFFIVPFFIYLTGLQLLVMFKQHDHKLWLDLYPISITKRMSAFLELLLKLMLSKGVFLSLLLLWIKGIQASIFTLAISIIFSYLFVQFYLKTKLLKMIRA